MAVQGKNSDAHSGKANHYVNILQSTNVFAPLSREELFQMLEFSEERKFRKDQRIFSQGDPSDCMYVVIDGEVVIEKKDDGAYQQVAKYIDNECFGESGLFLSQKRIADARAVGALTSVLRFPAATVRLSDMLRDRPHFCNALFNVLIAHVAHRIRSVNNLIRERTQWVNILKEQLVTDTLTGVYTIKSYKEEFLPALDAEREVIAAMVKPVNFKPINDRFGHEVGDAVLHKMGSIFTQTIGDAGHVFRYLGNEFAVVFQGLAVEEARRLIGRVIHNTHKFDLRSFGCEQAIKLSCASYMAHYPAQHADLSSLLDHAHEKFMEVFVREQ